METATYRLEFVVTYICVEQIIELYTTMRNLGIPVHEKNYLFGDKVSVVNFSSISHAKLPKHHTTLSFHCVHKTVASKYAGFHFLLGASNLADISSKHWSYAGK